MHTYAFKPVAGKGLGTSHSSAVRTEAIWPSHLFGSAQQDIAVNVATGNVIVSDFQSIAHELNGIVRLGFIYNSCASGNKWRLGLKSLQAPHTGAATIDLIEVDGHVASYALSLTKEYYVAPGCGSGRARLQYVTALGQWEWFDPASGRREYYDTQGKLMAYVDAAGRRTMLEYDAHGQLSKIVPPFPGRYYQIDRYDNKVTFYLVENAAKTLLHTCVFDAQGVLQQTLIGASYRYQIHYSYSGPNKDWLKTIEQSDQSSLSFSYQIGANSQPTVNYVVVGKDALNDYYKIIPKDAHTFLLEDAQPQTITITVDDELRLTKIERQQGDDGPGTLATTTYTYTGEGQLYLLTRPNGASYQHMYNQWGLLGSVTGPEGHFYNDVPDNHTAALLTHTESLQLPGQVIPRDVTTRYVYDFNFDKKHLFLRFKISPCGRVTEYRPDTYGSIASVRRYTKHRFDTSHLLPNQVPTVLEMMAWVEDALLEDPQAVILRDQQIDGRGMLGQVMQYTEIDKEGNGVLNPQTSLSSMQWALFGGQVQQTTVLKPSVYKTCAQSYDGVYRKTFRVLEGGDSKLSQHTSYKYTDAKAQSLLMYPNEREREQTFDSRRLVSQELAQASDVNQERQTEYDRDPIGRAVLVKQPDETEHFHFYDRQSRLIFSVSPLGAVVEHQYDEVIGLKTQIAYAIPIDVSKLMPFPGMLPNAQVVRTLLHKDPLHDRTSYELCDQSNRLELSVDSENYATQKVYDSLDRELSQIRYHTPLTATQIAELKQGKLNLVPDAKAVSQTNYFYDDDGLKIGEQDPAGYVTQSIRDEAGQIIEKIHYSVPVTLTYDWSKLKLQPSEKDAHHYYFYNPKGECVAEIDAENYLIEREYYAGGQLQRETRYATQLNVDPSKITHWRDIIPPINSEDQTSTYEYDDLGRKARCVMPGQREQTWRYDHMDHVVESRITDQLDTKQTRATQYRYDEWGQIIAEAPPLISALLDQATTAKEKEAIWQNKAIRYHYDASGLRLSKTDSLNYVTYYCYDAERRLRFSVDARGAITEYEYNVFREKVTERQYATMLDAAQRQTFSSRKSGILSPEQLQLFQSLQSKTKDSVNQFARDRRGLMIQHTDPVGNVTSKAYDYVKQCVREVEPATEAGQLVIARRYDPRGLMQDRTRTVGKHQLTESFSHDNPFGKQTSYVDANQAEHQTAYDKRGLRHKTTDPLGHSQTFLHDAFQRVSLKTSAAGRRTRYHYAQATRSMTAQQLDQQGQTMSQHSEQHNAFAELMRVTNGLNQSREQQYNPQGEVIQITDEDGFSTYAEFNDNGWQITHTDADGVITQYILDPVGNMLRRLLDPDGLKIITSLLYDAFNHLTERTDPNGILHTLQRDQRGLVVKSITDPTSTDTGLNLTVVLDYDAVGQKWVISRGDGQSTQQRTIHLTYDGFHRSTGQVVDPDGLKIINIQIHDGVDHVCKEQDANGRIIRHFYDAAGNKRFTVNADGVVLGWLYEADRLQTQARVYSERIDPTQLTDETTLEAMQALAKTIQDDEADRITCYFYDDIGRLQFTTTNTGSVVEKIYDAANRVIATRAYAFQIQPPSQLLSMTTAQLQALLVNHEHDATNRVTYRILSAAGRERFTIDGEGYITERCFDGRGRIILRIRYATKLADPASIAALPADAVRAQIPKDAAQDRVEFNYFEANGKPSFIVKVLAAQQGVVTRFQHDPNGNLLESCVFAEAIHLPTDYLNRYAEIKALLTQLQPDPKKDRITQHQFDAANRKITDIDPLGFADHYTLDALDQLTEHRDRNGAEWQQQFDGAGRITQKRSPAITTGEVTPTGAADGRLQLQSASTAQSVVSGYEHDGVGNQTALVYAKGSDAERRVEYDYNGSNKPSATTVIGALVDDGSTTTPSYIHRPEVSVNVKSKIIYNTENKPLVQIDEAGYPKFTIYDPDQRPIYSVFCHRVLEKGYEFSVIAYTHSAFGDVLTETAYATPIEFNDISSYLTSGLPASMVHAKLVLDPENDRIKEHDYDRRGLLLQETLQHVPYYVDPGSKPVSGFAQGETRLAYNAFREKTYYALLQDPVHVVWQERFCWYGLNGKIVAEVDPENFVTTLMQDNFGQNIQKSLWANPLDMLVQQNTPLAAILAKIVPNAIEDQITDLNYDLRGDVVAKILQGYVGQALDLSQVKPSYHDLPPQNLITRFVYNPTQQRIVIIHPDGATERTYFNFRGDKIAYAGIAREQEASPTDANPKTLIPLTYFFPNVHGQVVAQIQYVNGTSAAGDALPVPVKTDPQHDQTTLWYFAAHGHGLLLAQQNAEEAVRAFTYTDVAKIAREFYQITNPVDKRVDMGEQRFEYSPQRRSVLEMSVLNGTVTQRTANDYSAFGNRVKEYDPQKPGDYLWWRYAVNNMMYATNAQSNHAPEFQLCNLAGQVTLIAISQSDDLSTLSLADFLAVLEGWGKDPKRLARRVKVRDKKGRMIGWTTPSIPNPNQSHIDNLLLNVQVGDFAGKYSIFWTAPTVTLVKTTQIKLYPVSNPDFVTMKTVYWMMFANYSVVNDLEDLSSDVYGYEMDFQFDDKTHFRTQGVLQLDTSKTTQSQSLVVLVNSDQKSVRLSGNTRGLTAVELFVDTGEFMQYTQPVATIPVSDIAKVDLNSYPAGHYRVRAVGTTSHRISLPFTVYTDIAPQHPLARAIDCQDAKLNVLLQYGLLQWKISEPYAQQSVQITCHYTGNDDQKYQQTAELKPGQTQTVTIGEQTFTYNFQFDQPVKYAERVQLAVQVDGQWVPVLDQVAISSGPSVLPDGVVAFDMEDLVHEYPLSVTQTLYVTGLPAHLTDMTFSYFDTSLNTQAFWQQVTAKPVGNPLVALAVDVSGKPAGHYPFCFGAAEADASIYRFTLGTSSVYTSNRTITSQPASYIVPFYQVRLDRFDRTTKTVDCLGHPTTHTYNKLDRVLQTVYPEIEVVDSKNQQVKAKPTQAHGYNVRGRLIASKNPNQHVSATVRDAAQQEITVIVGDGTRRHFWVRDIFGNGVKWFCPRGFEWQQTFNRMNLPLVLTPPGGSRREQVSYNELSLLREFVDGKGGSTLYDYDERKNIAKRDAVGKTATMAYARDHRKTDEWDSDGHRHWVYSFGGKLLHRTDLGNATANYDYNFAGGVTHVKSNQVGGHGNSLELHLGADTMGILNPPTYTTPGLNMAYVYREDGATLWVKDHGAGVSSQYIVDEMRRVTGVHVHGYRGQLKYSSSSSLNALGWATQITTSNGSMTLLYDVNSNHRHLSTTIYARHADGSADNHAQSGWWTYDEAERVLAAAGVRYGYTDSVGRLTDLRMSETRGGRTFGLSYTQDNLFAGTTGIVSSRRYDQNAEVTHIETGAGEKINMDYTAQGFQRVINHTIPVPDSSTTSSSNTHFHQFTAQGQPSQQNTVYTGDEQVSDELNASYSQFMQPVLREWKGKRTIVVDGKPYTNNDYSSVKVYVEPAGVRQGIIGGAPPRKPDPDFLNNPLKNYRTVYYLNDTAGHVLESWEFVFIPQLFFWNSLFETAHSRYLFSPTGELLAGVTQRVQSHSSFAIGTIQNAIKDDVKFEIDLGFLQSPIKAYHPRSDRSRYRDEHRHRDQEIDTTFPPAAPPTAVAVPGQGFADIAQQYYGDASLAAAVAYANDATVGYTPAQGQILHLPQAIATHNNVHTHTPYSQFLTTIYGAVQPRLTTPSVHHHDTLWLQIVEAVVSIAVIVAAPHVAAALLSTEVSALTTTEMATTMAIAGALSDAVQQGLAIAAGQQQRFSLVEVFSRSVTSALLYGYGGGLGQMGFANTLLAAGAMAVEEQLVQMAEDPKHRFDLRQVAVQAFTAAVTAKVMQPATKSLSTLKYDLASDAVDVATESIIETVVYQRPVSMEGVASRLVGDVANNVESAALQAEGADSASVHRRDAARLSAQHHGIARTAAAANAARWETAGRDAMSHSHAHVAEGAHEPMRRSRQSYFQQHSQKGSYLDVHHTYRASIAASHGVDHGAAERNAWQSDWNDAARLSTVGEAGRAAHPSVGLFDRNNGDSNPTAISRMHSRVPQQAVKWQRVAEQALDVAGDDGLVDQLVVQDKKRNYLEKTADFLNDSVIEILGINPEKIIRDIHSFEVNKSSFQWSQFIVGLKGRMSNDTLLSMKLSLGTAHPFSNKSSSFFRPIDLSAKFGYDLGRLGSGIVGFFGGIKVEGAESSRLLLNVERVSSNEVNKSFISDDAIAAGWKPPYPENLSIRKIITNQELKFYRVHIDSDRVAGRFLAREKEIAPFLNDPEALRVHLGLPDVPIYITEVNVPTNTELYVGRIGEQPEFGLNEESGFQYQVIGKLPLSNFVNTRPIIKPNLDFDIGY